MYLLEIEVLQGFLYHGYTDREDAFTDRYLRFFAQHQPWETAVERGTSNPQYLTRTSPKIVVSIMARSNPSLRTA